MHFRKAHKVLFYLLIILVILIAFVAFIVFLHKSDYNAKTAEPNDYPTEIQAGTFDLNDYKTKVHQFRVDYCVDPIDSAQAAAKSAIRLWEKWGYDAEKYSQPQVYYDSNTECWLVISSPPNFDVEEGVVYVYETPVVLIQADGTVLATWLK